MDYEGNSVVHDLVISNCRLDGHDQLVDIVCDGAFITAIETSPQRNPLTARRLNAHGALVTPSFVQTHTHPDKAFSHERIPSLPFQADPRNRAELMRRQVELKSRFTVDDVEERATRFFRLAAANGIGVLRGQVDIDSVTGLTSFEGVLRARAACADLLDVQLTAFPQEGLVKDSRAEDLLRQALASGADYVGGWPNNEASPDDQVTHLNRVFDLSEEFQLPIDINIDYFCDPTERMLEPLALGVRERGIQRLVSANHVGALEMYDDAYAAHVIEQVAEAEISVTICPSNLVHSRHHRGVSRPHQLMEKGVNLTAGVGNFHDNWQPLGNLDSAALARLTYHALGLSDIAGVDLVWELVSTNGGRALGLDNRVVAVGAPADLVIFDVPDRTAVVRGVSGTRTVIKNGKIVGGLASNLSVQDAA